jgi:hypothetical protein
MSQKFVWGLLDRICSLDSKSLKNYWKTKSTNLNENFPKKVCYLKKEKELKICMGATRRNLQAQPNILKKISERQNN